MAIAGASGYAGGELVRLLAGHPHFQVKTLAAGAKAGQSVGSVHPHLAGWRDKLFTSADPEALAGHDLVFLALPHGASAEIAAALPDSVKVVDLGADFRLRSSADWQKYYGSTPHAGHWTYGLPEIVDHALISGSQRVANPGCYATGIALAAAPLVAAGLMADEDLVVVAASGTSGAGRTPSESLLASEVMGSISSYKTGGVHQHTPEIEQTLRALGGRDVRLSFTPLLAPMPRGIHVTLTAKLNTGAGNLQEVFNDFYAAAEFITVLGGIEQPRTSSVIGSNQVHLQALTDVRTSRAVITLVLDNLVKGAAGQAIQNANLMFGLPEAAGLPQIGVAP